MKKIFSLVTPSYQRLAHLKKLYKHIKNQKKNRLVEWVVVVEKKDKQTIGFLKSIKKKLNLIIVYNKGGLTSAFKNGANKATGAYVSFLGDDDYFKNDIFVDLYDIIKKNRPKWIIGYGSYVNNKNLIIRKNITYMKKILLNNFNLKTLLLVDYVMCPSSFCKKELLKKVGYFENTHWYGNDYVCWIRLSKFIKPLIVKDTLSYVRYNSLTKSGSFDLKRFLSLYKIISKETNSFLINILQLIIVGYIIFHNFVLKKIIIKL